MAPNKGSLPEAEGRVSGEIGRARSTRGERSIRLSTRELIMASSVKTFARLGYDTATVAEIAAEAGLSHQTVRNHFQSKQRLFADVLRLGWQRVHVVAAQRVAAANRAEDKLAAIMQVWLELRRENRALVELLWPSLLWRDGAADHLAGERHPEGYARFLNLVLEVIKQGQRDAQLTARVSAHAVCDLVAGALTWMSCGPLLRGGGDGYGDETALETFRAALRGLSETGLLRPAERAAAPKPPRLLKKARAKA